MALDKQLVALSLSQGMDTKTDPKQVQLGDLILLTNAVYNQDASISPRYGYSALSQNIFPSGTISAGNALGVLNSNLLMTDGTNLYSYSPTLLKSTSIGSSATRSISTYPGLNVSTKSLDAVTDSAYGNGYTLFVGSGQSSSFDTLIYNVIDNTSGSVVTTGSLVISAPNNFLSQPSRIQAAFVSNKFYIFVGVENGASSKSVYYSEMPQTTFVPGALTQISTPVASSTALYFDLCVNGSFIDLVTYNTSGSVNNVVLYKFDPSTNTATNTAVTSATRSAIAVGVCCDSSTSNIFVTYATTGTVYYRVYTANLVSVLAETSVATITGAQFVTLTPAASAGICSIFYWYITGTVVQSLSVRTVGTSGALSAATLVSAYLKQASKPVVASDGYLYINTYFSRYFIGAVQANYYQLRYLASGSTLSTAVMTARFFTDKAGYGTVSFYETTSNVLQASLEVSTSIGSSFGTITARYTAFGVTFGANPKNRNRNLAETTLFSGGLPRIYDGLAISEQGFNWYPEALTAGTPTATGSGVDTGTYSYLCVFLSYDSKGQVNRSSPGTAITVVVPGANYSVPLSIPSYDLTQKSKVYVEIYRTTASGTIYYLLATVANGTTSYSDTAKDATITGNLQLYTTGGEVENIAVPASGILTTFKNRVFMVPYDSPNSFWYSKQVIDGTPIEFSDLFVTNMDQTGGSITAMIAMDDKLVIFKDSNIFYITGDGPAPSGANNDFSYPQLIPSDCGCTELDSVLSTPAGIFFKGRKGIYLLGRNLSVQYVGDKVEAYNSYSISSANLAPNTTQARFTLNNGTAIVYDYYEQKWCIFSNISAVDAVIYNNTYTYLNSSGLVQSETTAYSDNGSVIPMSLTTGWLSLAKIQGFERIYKLLLLGQNYSANSVAVSIAYDFDPTIVQTATITNTAAENPWQWRVNPSRQKCESMQLTITVTPAVVGQALSLSSLGIQAGVKTGTNTIAASRSTS